MDELIVLYASYGFQRGALTTGSGKASTTRVKSVFSEGDLGTPRRAFPNITIISSNLKLHTHRYVHRLSTTKH